MAVLSLHCSNWRMKYSNGWIMPSHFTVIPLVFYSHILCKRWNINPTPTSLGEKKGEVFSLNKQGRKMFSPLSWKLHTTGAAVNAVFNFSVLHIIHVAEVFCFCLLFLLKSLASSCFCVCYTGQGDEVSFGRIQNASFCIYYVKQNSLSRVPQN